MEIAIPPEQLEKIIMKASPIEIFSLWQSKEAKFGEALK